MQHEQHRVPVTALSWWSSDIVLSGEGTVLNAYHARTRTRLCCSRVFKDQQIHGIVTAKFENDAFALVWGGSSICKVALNIATDGTRSLHPGRTYQARDWILDVALAPCSGETEVRAAIVTAHNALTVCDLDRRSEDLKTLEPVVPGSNCILYSAHLKWLSSSECLVAAGTAFGDIVVWSCLLNREEIQLHAVAQTHFVFSAHEGSVFGVHISADDVATAIEGRQHVLASCSDDRTIRLWDISDLSAISPTFKDIQQETGFGGKEAEEKYAPKCIGKAMAHISRIWHIRFSLDRTIREPKLSVKPSVDLVHILSFGEDSSYILWSLQPASTQNDQSPVASYNLKQCGTRKSHRGKNIWSLTLDLPGEIVTGGADGAIAMSDETSGLVQEASHSNARLYNTDNQKSFGIIKTYAFRGPDELIATTEEGAIIRLSPSDTNILMSYQLSPPISGLRGYSVLSCASGVAFIAGADGAIYMCLPGVKTAVPFIHTSKKVARLFAQPVEDTRDDSMKIALLVTHIDSAIAKFYLLTPEPNHTQKTHINVVNRQDIELPSGFNVTCFTCWTTEEYGCVALGSRHGSLSFFRVGHDPEGQVTSALHREGLHGKESVTTLRIADKQARRSGPVTLFSTGRDGTYAAYTVYAESDSIRMQTVHKLSIPFGPNIEGLDDCSGSVRVWGFRSTRFVVYDVNTEQEVFAVQCGGAHRAWAFQTHPETGIGVFVWTKASELFYERKGTTSTHMIKQGGHGRDIKTVAISPKEPPIIATGSEDTDIKLNTYSETGFHSISTLQRHDTGIQHLQWSTDGKCLFSSGGFEEFFVWRITPNVRKIGIGVVCESSHPNTRSSDLRITTFHAKTSDQSPGSFQVIMLYSDSTIKCWQYAPLTHQWDLLGQGEYLAACPTSCLDPEGSPGFITAGTDGHLTTWPRPLLSTPPAHRMAWRRRQAVHQNAILSLAACRLADGSLLVVTGGDDNAVAISRFCEAAEDTGTRTVAAAAAPAAVLRIPRAHAAAVTGLVLFAGHSDSGTDFGDTVWMVSAGIDQRVKLWKIEVDVQQPGVEGLRVQRCASVFTAVADVSGIERIPLDNGKAEGVLISGVGMDVWRLGCLGL